MTQAFLSFFDLLPDTIFKVVQTQGYYPTGALYPLNSYENRVYEIHLEDHDPIVAKFYRPGRWSMETIWDEHRFLKEIEDAEIPVVCPLDLDQAIQGKSSLGKFVSDEGALVYYALYPKFRGREEPDLNDEKRKWLGRSMARIHNVGDQFECQHRLDLNTQTYGYNDLDTILNSNWIPHELKSNIESLGYQVLNLIKPLIDRPFKRIPLHGDCHPGNVLWNHEGPTLLDFDDMVIAPPIQDIWMLFYGDEEEKRAQKDSFFEGYETFREFDYTSMILIEPLRTLRLIHHSAWIGKRYDEPMFKKAFPYYTERRYWEEFLLNMKEQIGLLQEL